MKLTLARFGTVLIAALVLALLIVASQRPREVSASTPLGGEYQATTTNTFTTVTAQADRVLLSTNGTLGAITITGANSGTINLYDATTSNISDRTGQVATNTILVASFPASTAAGTYTFDRVVVNGLYLSVSGTAPTSTIMYR